MKKRLLYVALASALLIAAGFAALTNSASAVQRTITVQLADGQVITITVDIPPGTPLDQIQLPGEVVPPGTPSTPPASQQGAEQPSTGEPPKSDKGEKQKGSGSDEKAEEEEAEPVPGTPQAEVEPEKKDKKNKPKTEMRNPDGSPAPSNPSAFDALPGPSSTKGVPNFVIRKFRVPIFLLPIYQAAGIQYGIRWEILAAINEIETDYGRNLNVSSAGAMGWMQFIPSSWRAYGVDANKDGRKDPYNPVDAIFAAARYLKAAGYEKDVRRAIFAYNHADWYVDSVMLRAKLIAGVPGDLVGSLTGLTEGRFPVYAKARYADDLSEREASKRVKRGQNAANVVESDDERRGIEIFARKGSPAVAVNDGEVKKIGRSEELGRYIVLQDVYGNQFTYAGLDSVSTNYPVPKDEALDEKVQAKAISAKADAKPGKAASAGRQVDDSDTVTKKRIAANAKSDAPTTPRPTLAVKERLFANPTRAGAREAGGADQILAAKKSGFSTFKNYFSRPVGLDPKEFRLKRLKKGSRVIGGTILGRVGTPVESKASHLYFEIRPAGKGAPKIDPKPILDGWKLLEATAIYRASGKNALRGDDDDAFSIGQILLLPKPLLEKRVLSDERIDIYDCGREDIQSGQIDRRVLATLAYLAESGLRPSVSSLKCGHSFYTSAGGVSHHSSGNAVDVWAVNGIPILGHQEKGGITEQTLRSILKLQGTLAPDQLISLLDLGGPSFALGDHADHIHVGFSPRFGTNPKAGKQALAVLKPGQWNDLLKRLRQIDNPVVPTKPSKVAIPVKDKKSERGSEAHEGD